MRLKAISGIILTLLLTGMLTLTFKAQTVKASGTIYIRADGSVDPPTVPISTVDNVTYTFTDNLYDSIVVERDNIVIDGTGYTLQGTGSGRGIDLSARNNITVKNMGIKSFAQGIYLYGSSNNHISGNNITANNDNGIEQHSCLNNSISGNNITNNSHCGIFLCLTDYNSISGNRITNNDYGIWIWSWSSHNSISGNNLTNNQHGILLSDSPENSIYHNNFNNNTYQASTYDSANVWDDGYPSGGNYWSDYAGVDVKSGPYQNVTGSDGMGDTPYVIDADNKDRYPLMYPFGFVPGDVNGDKKVNILDAILLANAFGSKPGSPNWNPRADFNNDNVVNILDAIILANNFGKKGP